MMLFPPEGRDAIPGAGIILARNSLQRRMSGRGRTGLPAANARTVLSAA
jgi:hypothetical protein